MVVIDEGAMSSTHCALIYYDLYLSVCYTSFYHLNKMNICCILDSDQ